MAESLRYLSRHSCTSSLCLEIFGGPLTESCFLFTMKQREQARTISLSTELGPCNNQYRESNSGFIAKSWSACRLVHRQVARWLSGVKRNHRRTDRPSMNPAISIYVRAFSTVLRILASTQKAALKLQQRPGFNSSALALVGPHCIRCVGRRPQAYCRSPDATKAYAWCIGGRCLSGPANLCPDVRSHP